MDFKFGVRAHDMVSKTDIDTLLDNVVFHGFEYIQLVFPKALDNASYSEENVSRVKKSLEKHNVRISMLGAYFNPVDPDRCQVEKGIRNFEENLRIMNSLQAPYVGSETGSYNGSPWTYNPKNQTEEGYQESKSVFAGLLKKAEEYDGHILIEPAYGHVMYCVKRLKRLVDELDSSRVDVTVDLYNLLYEGNFEKREEIFTEALTTFRSRIKVIHLKDASIDESGRMVQLAPGEGSFNYPRMLREIKCFCPEAVLTFEGVKSDKIDKSYKYLSRLAELIAD